MTKHIKCPNCGIYNTDRDYCKNCNTLLSYEKIRELEYAEEEKEREERERISEEKFPSFYDKYKDHRYLIVRLLAKTSRSIWLGFLAVGILLAWIIAAIAA